MSPSKKLVLALVTVVGGIVLLGAGFAAGVGSHLGTAGVSYALQDTVLKHLESSYYQAIDPSALETDAINGMVAGLNDPYTVYLDPSALAGLNADLSGHYSGVGMAEEMENGFITTVTVFKGSPAADAGLQPGDIIVSVDGVPTAGLNIQQVVTKIQGKSGTTLTLGIYRPPASYVSTTTTLPPGSQASSLTAVAKSAAELPPGGTTRQYSLVRGAITVPQVDSEILTANEVKVAHITLHAFSKGSANALRAAVTQAVATDKVGAVVLDIRGNGGGLLDEGVAVASIFIPQGVIVTTQGLHSPKHSYSATGGAYPQIRLYLLVDQDTASASEIVAGALQDYKRATLIGVTTFGKGLVQSIEPLANGGAVKVTSAEYFTPSGRNINKKGIIPDVVVRSNPATPNVDAPLQEALKLVGGSATTP